MSVYGGKEMAASFRTVRRNTIQIAEDIPENKYDFKASPDTRSIGQTLAHIGVSPAYAFAVHENKISDMTTIDFPELLARVTAAENKPRTKAELIAFLTTEGERFAAFLDTLPDDFLAERIAMMPGAEPASRTRFDMLLAAKEHEMHHRAQLMVLERMLGITPHLTRQHEERMQRLQPAAQPAR